MGRGFGSRIERNLVGLRQAFILLLVDEEVHRSTTFPEGRVILVWRDLVEAELLVVIGADPFGGVDRAALQRRIDVDARKRLRNDAEPRPDFTGNSRCAHLQALAILKALNFLAIPAAHLRSGVAPENTRDAVSGEAGIITLVAAAVIEPCVLQARIHAERNGRA